LERENKYKLILKNFWRNNQKLIKYIGVAGLIGLLIAGINLYTYETSQNKYSMSESVVINSTSGHDFQFSLDNPALATGTTLNMRFNNSIESSNPVTVTVNDEEVAEITQQEAQVTLGNGVLSEENQVSIRRRDFGFNDQYLLSASVNSTTGLQEIQFVLLNFVSILLIFLPIGYVKYQQYQEKQKMEEEFPEFLRDIIEGTRAGMSLPQAIKNTEGSSYGALDEEIQKMSAQIEWGVPFDEVLQEFGKGTGSSTIQRAVDTIIQAYESGGNIQDVLENVGDNIRSIKQLKEKRQSQLYGEMVTGYIVYFIFIGILVSLTTYLLPNLAEASSSLGGSLDILGGGSSGGSSLEENIAIYKQWFTRLVYVQAIFSGLIIGKLAEGELKAGFKHVAILFASGYLATTIFL